MQLVIKAKVGVDAGEDLVSCISLLNIKTFKLFYASQND